MLLRSDYDQAARYLKYACELLERETPAQTRALRKVLELAVRRLSPGDHLWAMPRQRLRCCATWRTKCWSPMHAPKY
jgi:hypothetical protein